MRIRPQRAHGVRLGAGCILRVSGMVPRTRIRGDEFPPKVPGMNLVVNGKPHSHGGGGTLAELFEECRANPAQVAVMINGEVVRRAQWDSVKLVEGDQVEMLVFAAGG